MCTIPDAATNQEPIKAISQTLFTFTYLYVFIISFLFFFFLFAHHIFYNYYLYARYGIPLVGGLTITVDVTGSLNIAYGYQCMLGPSSKSSFLIIYYHLLSFIIIFNHFLMNLLLVILGGAASAAQLHTTQFRATITPSAQVSAAISFLFILFLLYII